MSKGLAAIGDPKLPQDNAPLPPLYGLLVTSLRPNCLREGVDDIRCRLCFILAVPLSLADGSIGMASKCSVAISEELGAERTSSGKVVAMINDV